MEPSEEEEEPYAIFWTKEDFYAHNRQVVRTHEAFKRQREKAEYFENLQSASAAFRTNAQMDSQANNEEEHSQDPHDRRRGDARRR